MARLLHPARRALLLSSTASSSSSSSSLLKTLIPPPTIPFSRNYISEMRQSAFQENLLRVLRTEIDYESNYVPSQPPAASFKSFSVEDRPGEQWIRLRSKHGDDKEDIKVDATMFDGAAPPPTSLMEKAGAYGSKARLHISLVVEVSKGDASDCVLEFVCSAWPDSLDIQKVFPLRRGGAPIRPYMGRDFKELDEELQNAMEEYLEERGVNDELAEFLHWYMVNKDKTELVRWLRNIDSYVKK